MKRPHTGSGPAQILLSVMNNEPKPVTDHNPDLPEGLWPIIRKMIHRDLDTRYRDCKKIIHDLDALRGGAEEEDVVSEPFAGGEVLGRQRDERDGDEDRDDVGRTANQVVILLGPPHPGGDEGNPLHDERDRDADGEYGDAFDRVATVATRGGEPGGDQDDGEVQHVLLRELGRLVGV